jgi:hypothetical protein
VLRAFSIPDWPLVGMLSELVKLLEAKDDRICWQIQIRSHSKTRESQEVFCRIWKFSFGAEKIRGGSIEVALRENVTGTLNKPAPERAVLGG